MKQILIPTDFSEDSMKAYQVGASIAREKKYGIHLYHIVENHLSELSYWIYGIYGLTQINNEMKQKMKEADELLKEHAEREEFKGVEVTTSLSESAQSPSQKVVEKINDTNYEFVILGTSTTENDGNEFATLLSRYTRRPLMIVKSDIGEFKMKNTLICIDFDRVSQDFLSRLKHFSSDHYQNFDFLVVNTPSDFKSTDEIEKKYKDFILRHDLTRTQLIVRNDYSIKEGVQKAAAKWNYDVIALVAEGRKSWQYLFMGSETEDIIKSCQQSLFIMNLDHYQPKPIFTHQVGPREKVNSELSF